MFLLLFSLSKINLQHFKRLVLITVTSNSEFNLKTEERSEAALSSVFDHRYSPISETHDQTTL